MIDLEEQREKIDNQKTKIYFSEPLSSFYNGNYRAAIVGLYSVVIYDLLIKIDELAEYYNLQNAKSAIKAVKEKQRNQETGEWEITLIDQASKIEGFLESSIIANINHLRNIRHLCAHPALDSNYELFTPSKMETLALIEFFVKNLFTQQPLFSGKITEYLSEKIAQFKYSNDVNFEFATSKIAESMGRRFSRMNDDVYCKVFKNFWKFAFFTNNGDCLQNRFSNVAFLFLLIEKRKDLIIQLFDSEKKYFSDKIVNDNDVMYYLATLIIKNEFLFNKLERTQQSFVFDWVNQNKTNKIRFSMIHADFDAYLEYLKQNVDVHDEIWELLGVYQNNVLEKNKKKLRDLFYNIYLSSEDFGKLDRRIDLIDGVVNDITKDELIFLLTESEQSGQITRKYFHAKGFAFYKKIIAIVKSVGLSQQEIEQFEYFNKMYQKA